MFNVYYVREQRNGSTVMLLSYILLYDKFFFTKHENYRSVFQKYKEYFLCEELLC